MLCGPLLAGFANLAAKVIVAVLTLPAEEEGHAVQQVEDHIQNIYTGIILVLQMVNDLFLLDPPRLKSLLVHINASSLMIGIKRRTFFFLEEGERKLIL